MAWDREKAQICSESAIMLSTSRPVKGKKYLFFLGLAREWEDKHVMMPK